MYFIHHRSPARETVTLPGHCGFAGNACSEKILTSAAAGQHPAGKRDYLAPPHKSWRKLSAIFNFGTIMCRNEKFLAGIRFFGNPRRFQHGKTVIA